MKAETAVTQAKVAGPPSPALMLLGAATCLALVAFVLALLAYGGLAPALWQWPLLAFALPFLLVGIPLALYVLRWGWRVGLHRFEEQTQTDWDGGGIGASPEPVIERLLPVNIPEPDDRIKLAGAERSYGKGDLRHLVDLIWRTQPSARSLKGHRLPSGEILSSYEDDVQPFFQLLARFRLIGNFGEGQRYTLSATHDEALQRLHL